MDVPGSNLITVHGVQHHDTVLDRLWGLVQSREKVDFGLAGCGRLLRAHQLVLGLFFEPEQLLEIGPQHWQDSSLELLLQFVYLGTVCVPEEQLDTLLELARQLEFTMLVDALLLAKNSTQLANPSTSWTGFKIEESRCSDTDSTGSLIEPAQQPPDTIDARNSAEAIRMTTRDFVPIIPKVEADSDDSNYSNEPTIFDPIPAEWQQIVDGGDDRPPCLETNFELDVAKSKPNRTSFSLPNGLSVAFDGNSGGSPEKIATSLATSNKVLVDCSETSKTFFATLSEKVTEDRTNKSGSMASAGKKFECSTCHKVFGRPSQLTIHCRIHTGEKPYTCGFCQKAFSRAHTLKTHVRIHTGEKPYECECCAKAFADLAGKVRHHARHHRKREESYKCDVCFRSFVSGAYLKRHYLTQHSLINT